MVQNSFKQICWWILVVRGQQKIFSGGKCCYGLWTSIWTSSLKTPQWLISLYKRAYGLKSMATGYLVLPYVLMSIGFTHALHKCKWFHTLQMYTSVLFAVVCSSDSLFPTVLSFCHYSNVLSLKVINHFRRVSAHWMTFLKLSPIRVCQFPSPCCIYIFLSGKILVI